MPTVHLLPMASFATGKPGKVSYGEGTWRFISHHKLSPYDHSKTVVPAHEAPSWHRNPPCVEYTVIRLLSSLMDRRFGSTPKFPSRNFLLASKVLLILA